MGGPVHGGLARVLGSGSFWVPDVSGGGNGSPLGRMISGRDGRLRLSIGGQWEGEEGAMEEGERDEDGGWRVGKPAPLWSVRDSSPSPSTRQELPGGRRAGRFPPPEADPPAEARRRRGLMAHDSASLRLCGRISSSRFTQRALPWERAKERLHVHEADPPAEAQRRRGCWLMTPRLCVSAGESHPANVPHRALPRERA